MTVIDPEQFISKDKLVIYTKTFVKLYNQSNYKQVYEIHKIIKLVKMRISTMENLYNLEAHWIIEISLVLYIAYIVPR